jgi:hypothetical protein
MVGIIYNQNFSIQYTFLHDNVEKGKLDFLKASLTTELFWFLFYVFFRFGLFGFFFPSFLCCSGKHSQRLVSHWRFLSWAATHGENKALENLPHGRSE